MRVVWTEHAYGRLDEAMAFIARDRPTTATAWLERILEAGESLAELPDRGRVVPEVSRDDVRELIISPYRLIYRRDSSTITITMVLHERRELSGRMLARDEEVAELPRAESARTRPLQGRSPRSHEHGPAIAAILLLEPVLDANYRAVTTATWAWDRGPEGGGARGAQPA